MLRKAIAEEMFRLAKNIIFRKSKGRKVLLIQPPFRFKEDWSDSITPFFPLGLGYLAANLIRHDFDVCAFDALTEGFGEKTALGDKWYQLGLTNDKILKHVRKVSPDLIGLSIPFTVQAHSAVSLAKDIKAEFPDIKIVVGGPHATIAPKQLAEMRCFDVVVQGEGELVLPLVAERLRSNETLEDIPGIWFRDPQNGNLMNSGKPEVISDLDDLPFPAWDIFNLKRLRSYHPDRRMTMITSRGCPYECVFCSIEQVMGRRFRARSPENVIGEVEYLVKKLGIKSIYFEDDNLTMNKKRAKRIFEMILERGLKFAWYPRNGVRLDTLDREMLQLMRDSGCGRLWISPESGSERILRDVINKKLDMDKVYDVVDKARSVGLPITCFFVIGFPQETRYDLELTLDMAIRLRKMGVDNFWFSCAVPYIGTQLYEYYKKIRPEIDDETGEFSTHEATMDTVDYSAAQIKRLREKAMAVLNDNNFPPVKASDIFKGI